MNTFLFFLFSQRVQILKTEYKYGQYCTPLSQSDSRYFLCKRQWAIFVLYLFAVQPEMLSFLKLTLAFLSSRFPKWLWIKRAFKMK